jgi:transketolase
MRTAFVNSLVRIAEHDPRVVLITGDLGFAALEPFAERFPDRFFNAGVAEQNMLGLATGLADSGFVPYAYSIATFASMRPYEFIRNGPALHELPVRVVGVGGGFDYGHNGVTHYALEDIGITRLQPGLTVVAPADPGQVAAALDALHELPGPVYLRIGKQSAPVPGLDGRFELGRPALIGDGRDVALIALGSMAATAVDVMDTIASHGIASTVAVISSFNPSPEDEIAELVAATGLVATMEGHYVVGGLSSFVSEVIAEHGLATRLMRFGVKEMPRGVTGSPQFLYENHGLSAAEISRAVSQALAFAQP